MKFKMLVLSIIIAILLVLTINIPYGELSFLNYPSKGYGLLFPWFAKDLSTSLYY